MAFPAQPIPKGVQPIPPVFEVIHYHPDKSDPEGTRKKLLAADAILAKHPDFVGIPFEGVSHEDPSLAVRWVEWKSSEGLENFRGSDLFKEYVKARKGAIVGEEDVNTYKYYSPLPVGPKAKCIEHITFTLKPDVFEDFYRAWSAGCEEIEKKCKGSAGFAWAQQIENPTIALQTQLWESLEDHVPGFKTRPDIKELMAPFYAAKPLYVVESGAIHVLTVEPGHVV